LFLFSYFFLPLFVAKVLFLFLLAAIINYAVHTLKRRKERQQKVKETGIHQ
jgi:hypothetical protein